VLFVINKNRGFEITLNFSEKKLVCEGAHLHTFYF
jgi:hypothetical protein